MSAGSGPSHVPALGAAGFDRRRDLVGFLAAAEQAVLAGMRIDGADADLRIGDAGPHQHLMSARDHALDQTGLDLLDRIDQADMRGDVNDAQLRRDQHHRHFRRTGQMRQQLGMTGIFMSGRMQRFLGERRGADALRQTRLHHLHGFLDIAIGRLAGRRRHLAERQIVRHQLQVHALHGFRREVRVLGIAQRIDLKRHADDPAGGAQAVGVADHQRMADRLRRPACASAFMMTSGPMPAGSPMVIAMVGRLM